MVRGDRHTLAARWTTGNDKSKRMWGACLSDVLMRPAGLPKGARRHGASNKGCSTIFLRRGPRGVSRQLSSATETRSLARPTSVTVAGEYLFALHSSPSCLAPDHSK